MKKIVFLFIAMLVLADEPSTQHNVTWNHIEVERSPREFSIPSPLWDQILSAAKESDKDNPVLVWMPIKVQLASVAEGILTNRNIEMNFPMGGGEVDFNQLVVGDKGSFYIKFLLDKNIEGQTKVFFYSRAKKRKLDDDIFGAGCNVYFDISKKFLTANSGKGVKVNVTDNRHLSVLGGHLIIASKADGKIYLTQVSFTDSVQRELLCQE